MRFTPVSVAFLALTHSIALGAPVRVDSLAVRQDISGLISSLLGVIKSVLGDASPEPIQGLEQGLQSLLAGALGLVPQASSTTLARVRRQPSPSHLASIPSMATTSVGLAETSVSKTSNTSSGTPQASSTTPARVRRQPSLSDLASIPSMVASVVGSQSAALPLQSIPASASPTASSKPTNSNPSPSARQV